MSGILKSIGHTFAVYVSQLFLLLRKDMLMLLKNWKTTILQLLTPFGFIFLLFVCSLVSINTDDKNPSVQAPVLYFPKCETQVPNSAPCVTIAYAYDRPNITLPFTQYLNETSVDFIMDLIVASTGLTLGSDVVKFTSSADLDAFITANPNHTLSGVVFYEYRTLLTAIDQYQFNTNDTTSPIPYSLYYNATGADDIPRNQILDSLDMLLEDALANFLVHGYSAVPSPSATPSFFTETTRKFPVVWETTKIDAIAFIGPLAFFCAIMFNQIIFMYNIVLEKELGLRQSLRTQGMKESMYWLSQVIINYVFLAIFSLVCMASGAIFQFRYFLDANWFAVFLNFFIFGLAMTPFAIFITMLVKTTRSAINAGMAVFILGALVQIIFGISYIQQVLYKPSTNKAFALLLQLWAPFNFAKMISSVTDKTPELGTGHFTWSDLTTRTTVWDDTPWQMPAPVDSWGYMFMDWGIYMVISLVLYNVLPSEGGWLYSKVTRLMALAKQRSAEDSEGSVEMTTRVTTDNDSDVMEEESVALKSKASEFPVVIRNLKKKYHKFGPFISTKSDVYAVKGVSLTVHDGEVFCLLGHNGAGKSTTLSMLVGEFPPSSGEALIYGHSILSELDDVRSMVGICPQADCLWPELTAREHLRIFAELKGVPFKQIPEEIDARLRDVNLLDVGNWRSKSYSGGMKRRLSVAISCIGNPKLILLDEPTTGLDPLSRRHLWGAIQRLKVGRVVLLTTHAMEEADALGDRIAIMAQGHVKCLGTPLHLKNKHGVGYVLNVSAPDGRASEARKFVEEIIPNAPLLASTSGTLKYGIPMERLDELVRFLQAVEAKKAQEKHENQDAVVLNSPSSSLHMTGSLIKLRNACPIADWGVSQTTLEEVFIKFGHTK